MKSQCCNTLFDCNFNLSLKMLCRGGKKCTMEIASGAGPSVFLADLCTSSFAPRIDNEIVELSSQQIPVCFTILTEVALAKD